MADNSKVFQLTEGMNAEKVGQAVVSFLRSRKKLTAEGAQIPNGYFVQAKSEAGNWAKLAGMDKAIQVRILSMGGDYINVSVGNGKWADKIGAGTVGFLLFPPMMLTAAFGAFSQQKLVSDIYNFIKEYLMSGGKNLDVMEIESLGSIGVKTDETECPKCHTRNQKDQKFCKNCGSPLGLICPSCGANVTAGHKFCPECGSPMKIKKTCAKCGAELSDTQKFCPECGAPAAGIKIGDIA